MTLFPLTAPIGGVALATTSVIGLGLGYADAALSQDIGKFGRTTAEALLGLGAGRLALRVAGLEETKFLWSTMRYHSAKTGRFITNAAGRAALMVRGVAESTVSIPFRLFDGDE